MREVVPVGTLALAAAGALLDEATGAGAEATIPPLTNISLAHASDANVWSGVRKLTLCPMRRRLDFHGCCPRTS